MEIQPKGVHVRPLSGSLCPVVVYAKFQPDSNNIQNNSLDLEISRRRIKGNKPS